MSLLPCQLLPRFTYLLRAGSRSASLSVVAVSKSSIDLIGDDVRNVTERPACGDEAYDVRVRTGAGSVWMGGIAFYSQRATLDRPLRLR